MIYMGSSGKAVHSIRKAVIDMAKKGGKGGGKKC